VGFKIEDAVVARACFDDSRRVFLDAIQVCPLNPLEFPHPSKVETIFDDFYLKDTVLTTFT